MSQVDCVFQCGAVCCSVLQCVAVCCSVLQCLAVCCSILLKSWGTHKHVAMFTKSKKRSIFEILDPDSEFHVLQTNTTPIDTSKVTYTHTSTYPSSFHTHNTIKLHKYPTPRQPLPPHRNHPHLHHNLLQAPPTCWVTTSPPSNNPLPPRH